MERDRYGAIKVMSKDVHAALRRALGPVAKPLGYRRAPGTSGCSFTSENGGLWQTFWVQVDKWGWEQWTGSAFTVEFQWDATPERGSWGDARTRWTALCSDSDLQVARDVNSATARSALPLPRLRRADKGLLDFAFEQERLDSLSRADEAWWPGLDVWCRYRDPQHVDAWASFFAERLPAMLDRFPPTFDRRQQHG